MYFISEIDPNYRIKGSRDPLGFQSIWSAAGHKAIKHLSTVSVNLKDFMVLSYGLFFYGERDSRGFLNFFYKFEQACAFARHIHNGENSFNGIEFVIKNKDKNEFSFSTRPSDTLLSNQRSYGVYGKYIRPYRDMAIKNDPDFYPVLETSLEKTDRTFLNDFIANLLNEDISKVTKEDLKCLSDLFGKITPEEKIFYRDHILKLPGENHPQNTLYDLLKNNEDILKFENFQLHSLIDTLTGLKNNEGKLVDALKFIQHTDRVLHPVNRIFSYLLSKSSWTIKQIEEDELINSIDSNQNYIFNEPTLRHLNSILKSNNLDMVNEIIIRNEKVSKSRGNQPWIIKERKNNTYKILYGENGQKIDRIDTDNQHEFPYFLDSYLSLYKQIELES